MSSLSESQLGLSHFFYTLLRFLLFFQPVKAINQGFPDGQFDTRDIALFDIPSVSSD